MFRKVRKFSTNVSKNLQKLNKRTVLQPPAIKYEIDDTDLKILRMLNLNPRSSLREVAAATGISLGTVRDRLSLLHKNNVIKGYATLINPASLGLVMTAIIKIFEKKDDRGILESKLKSMPNVFGIYGVTGDTDAVILARFKDAREIDNFVKRILRMRNVIRTETLIVLDTYKEDPRVHI